MATIYIVKEISMWGKKKKKKKKTTMKARKIRSRIPLLELK